MIMVHTILLIQSTPENDTPTYYEFQNTVESIQQVFKAYTDHLKYKYPHVEFLRCNNHSFFNFVNKEMGDVMVLTHNVSTNTYLPHDKKWLKKQAQDLFVKAKVVRDSSSKKAF